MGFGCATTCFVTTGNEASTIGFVGVMLNSLGVGRLANTGACDTAVDRTVLSLALAAALLVFCKLGLNLTLIGVLLLLSFSGMWIFFGVSFGSERSSRYSRSSPYITKAPKVIRIASKIKTPSSSFWHYHYYPFLGFYSLLFDYVIFHLLELFMI